MKTLLIAVLLTTAAPEVYAYDYGQDDYANARAMQQVQEEDRQIKQQAEENYQRQQQQEMQQRQDQLERQNRQLQNEQNSNPFGQYR